MNANTVFTITAAGFVCVNNAALNTRQASAKGTGKMWHTVAKKAPSLRGQAMSVLAGLGETFTYEQGIKALTEAVAEGRLDLGFKTPHTRLSHFLKNGHLAVVTETPVEAEVGAEAKATKKRRAA
jgi:hypothetical protein